MTRPAYYNEIDPFCCAVLRERIADGSLPDGIVDECDVRTVDPNDLQFYGQIHLFAGIGGGGLACRLAGVPDDFPLITAGVPCQPSSQAGNRRGSSDERWLWPEFFRILRGLRSHYALVEQPPGIASLDDGREWRRVLGELAEIVPHLEGDRVSAADIGASHQRERIWLVADPGCWGVQPGDDAGAIRNASAENAREGLQREWNAAEVRRRGKDVADAVSAEWRPRTHFGEHGPDGPNDRRQKTPSGPAARGARDRGRTLADANGGPIASGEGRSPGGNESELTGSRDGGDAFELADADGGRREEFRVEEFRGLESESGGEPYGRSEVRWLEHTENGGDAIDGAPQPAMGGAIDGLPAYMGGSLFPARPGEAQHPWEEPRLVERITADERKALAAYGNAWVPQAAVPALRAILARALAREGVA